MHPSKDSLKYCDIIWRCTNFVRDTKELQTVSGIARDGMSELQKKLFRFRPDENGHRPAWLDPLTDPLWLRPNEAEHMQADDPVLGLEFDDQAWALPWWIMKNHHVANLNLNGRAVLVNLCELCSSSAAFNPIVDGHRYMFRIGGLYNGTIMPTDDETGSLWTGFTGESIQGSLQGAKLQRLPLLMCTWQEWLELHPSSLVPKGEGESRIGHGEGNSPGSPMVSPRMRRMLQHTGDQLPHYELVLQVTVGSESRCYPLYALGQHGPVLNHRLGGEEIAVFSRAESWLACAFYRDLNGRCLTFRADRSGIVDEQTGSRWGISGVAESGLLKGKRLRYVPSGIEEYHIWAAFNPGMEIFGTEFWRPGPAHVLWGLEALPGLVSRTLKSGWWTRGMRVLVVGCGDGLLAAWLAESGLEVTAIDSDEQVVADARTRFRGVSRLKFRIGDFSRQLIRAVQFDAVVDHGRLSRVKPEERLRYAQNLAAVMRAGGHCMILAPVDKFAIEERARRIAKLFDPAFSFVSAEALPLPELRSGGIIDGGVFWLKRR